MGTLKANKRPRRVDVRSIKNAATRVAAKYFTSEEDSKGEWKFNPNSVYSVRRYDLLPDRPPHPSNTLASRLIKTNQLAIDQVRVKVCINAKVIY